MKTITTTIKRRWLAEIIAGTKKTECRERKPYWQKRLDVPCPFMLRPPMPEVTVLIDRVDRGRSIYRLHIAEVLSYKNWPVVR